MKAVAAASFQHLSRRGSRNVAAAASTARLTGGAAVPPVIPHNNFFSTLSGGNMLKQLTEENPHVDVVRYEHKNRKWSLSHVDYYSEALAIGFVENGLQPGDVVLSWLPQHFSESMVLQFACSKAGFTLYHLDPALAIENQELAKTALAKALEISQANILVSQEAGDDVNYVRLAEDVVPALAIFDFTDGLPFVTPDFPHLRFPIHTGFDQDDKTGWLPLKHMLVPSENLKEHLGGDVNVVTGSTPLLGSFTYDNQGVPTGIDSEGALTNEEVYQNKTWPTYSAVLDKEYHVVQGKGNVW